jgi:hypothetical protein
MAVGVEIAHGEITFGGIIQHDQAIRTYPEMPVAQLCDNVRTLLNGMISDVKHDEIIAGAMVFFKFDPHKA